MALVALLESSEGGAGCDSEEEGASGYYRCVVNDIDGVNGVAFRESKELDDHYSEKRGPERDDVIDAVDDGKGWLTVLDSDAPSGKLYLPTSAEPFDGNPFFERQSPARVALTIACKHGRRGAFEVLFQKVGGGGETASEILLDVARDRGGRRAQRERGAIVRQLLAVDGVDAAKKNGDGDSCLSISSHWGHLEIVQQLIEVRERSRGVRERDIKKETDEPRYYRNENSVVVVVLLSLLIRFIYTSNIDFSPSFDAFLTLDPQVKGIDLNVVDVDYESPLHVASKNGHASVVRLLLSRGGNGVDIDIQTQDGCTPLYQAAERGMFETVQVSVDPFDVGCILTVAAMLLRVLPVPSLSTLTLPAVYILCSSSGPPLTTFCSFSTSRLAVTGGGWC